MDKFFIVGSLIIILGVVAWFFGPRLIRTVALIAIVSPYEQQVKDAPTILVLGDSTGYGTGASKSSQSIAGLMGADFPQYSIVNNSDNGRTIGELVPIAKSVNESYQLILLQIGANDILQDRDGAIVESELREIFSLLSDKTDALIMMPSGNVGGAAAFSGDPEKAAALEARTREFFNRYQAVADETDLHFVNLFEERDVDPFVLQPDEYFASDGLHPNSRGYAYWYQSLQPVLRERLGQ